jgi:hypothetical protein
LHAKAPAEKRPREDTPSPEKNQASNDKDWHKRVQDDVEWAKGQIGKAAQGFKTDKIVSLGESVKDFLNVTLVSILVRQANTSSDLVTEIIRLNKENVRLNNAIAKQGEDISGVKLCKDRVEVKTSKKEMEEKIKLAVTQVKIVDLDLGKEFTDRKDLHAAAKETLSAKVRSDLRKSFDEKIRNATLKVLASKTFKDESEGKTTWTVPVLLTIPDRESRWEAENCLRSSKIYPGFHWPREMIDNVKIFRKVVKDMGYDDQSHYIRIRPEERDGVWRIRADAKKKTGDSKFVSVASFDIPPLDENLKKNVSGWATPTWTRKNTGATRDGTTATASASGARAAASAADMDFTEDDEIVNL